MIKRLANGPWGVSAAAAGMALLLAILAGPGVRAVALRAAQDETCKCKVTVECDPQKCIFTFDPAALAGMKNKDIMGLADMAIAHCKPMLDCFDRFGEKFVKNNLVAGLKDIQRGNRDACTFNTNVALEAVEAKCVVEDGKGGEVVVKLCSIAITLLPNNAGQMLKDHETGHVRIQENYNCELLKQFLQKRIMAEVCSKEYEDTKALEKDVTKMVSKFAKEFQQKVGKMSSYQQTYETATNVGTQGNQTQEADNVINDMDEKAKKEFPQEFP